jgi:hypothetical protein
LACAGELPGAVAVPPLAVSRARAGACHDQLHMQRGPRPAGAGEARSPSSEPGWFEGEGEGSCRNLERTG